MLNAWVDVARGFRHLARGGPLQGIARTLVVAWAALPALSDAVTSVRLAFRLRGERFGPRALVPVLERTLEHAGRVAAALELRGFGSRAAHQPGPGTGAPVLVRDAQFRIGDAQVRVAGVHAVERVNNGHYRADGLRQIHHPARHRGPPLPR